MNDIYMDDELFHIVTASSGRYPRGSGARPYQRTSFFDRLDNTDEKKIKAQQKIVNESGSIFGKVKEGIPKRFTDPVYKKYDLSKLSNDDLKHYIDRFDLEKKYINFMKEREPAKRRGAETVKELLSVAGTAAAVTSSALGIALAIKELRS